MKSFDIIYKNNKFYDIATQKRIYPKDGQKFLLVGDDQNFSDHDPLNLPPTAADLLDAQAKLLQVSQLKDVKKYHFLLVKGTRLYFDVNLTKLKSAGEESHYRFWIELLEDLYLHTCNNWQSEKSPALYGCHCKVDKEGSGNLDFLEITSLTDLA